MTIPQNLLSLSLCLSFFLIACAQSYVSPDINAPESWSFSGEDAYLSHVKAEGLDFFWWHQFNDVHLNEIVGKALENNHDLKIAQARIQEATASASYPSLLPTFSVTGNVSRQGGQSSLAGLDRPNNLSSVGVLAAWDLDLNGRLRHEDAARDAIVNRVRAEYDQTFLNLITQVAQTYLDVRYFQNLLFLIEKNVEVQKETVRVTSLQESAGAVGKLDSTRAKAQLLHTQARIPTVKSSLAKAFHRLSVLVAEPPQYMKKELDTKKELPVVAAPLFLDKPVHILRCRPDIKAAEFLFQEAFENKNVRLAEIFPNISLSGFFGIGRSAIYGASVPWSFGANILGNLLDFGRIESQIDVAEAQKQQSFLAFQRTILLAMEDVENNLISYSTEKEAYKKYEEEILHRRKALEIARLQFKAGGVDFLNVLNEEERLLDAEVAELGARYRSVYTMMSLYRSFGLPALADRQGAACQ